MVCYSIIHLHSAENRYRQLLTYLNPYLYKNVLSYVSLQKALTQKHLKYMMCKSTEPMCCIFPVMFQVV
jgi:hypothetical protein